MNILFFLTPKIEVAYVSETDSLRQVLEKMEHHGYAAIPLLTKNGKYVGTITEGDLLWEMKARNYPSLRKMESVPITSVKRRRDNRPVNAEANMEDLLDKVMNQNFVPVIDDDHVFIGLITRKDVISYLANKSKAD